MRQLLLARHGETAWNALGKLQGHTDVELDDVGRTQADVLAGTLGDAGLVAVWTSDLSRAQETGAIIATSLGLAAPTMDPELRERRFGVFEGLTRDECAVQHPEAWRAWLARTAAPVGGETIEAATRRMAGAMQRIAATPGGPALVVSHGGVMRLWLMEILGETIPIIGNCATWVIDHDGTAFRARPF